VRIADFDTDERVLVIAEIGNNHEGDFAAAEEMLHLAAEAGADAVKFQAIVPEHLVPPSQPERLAQLRRFQLQPEQFAALKSDADRAGVLFMCTPFDLPGVAMLDPLVPAFKVSSSDNDFFPLIEAVARTGKPIVLSSGLADLDAVSRSVDVIRTVWRETGTVGDPLAVLHCAVSYPTPPEEVHLAAIRELSTLGMTVGYSDHALGIEAAVLSVAAGARAVEKHFTSDKHRSDFRDHLLSADSAEFRSMVERIREADVLLGRGAKRVQPTEAQAASAVRRSIAAARDLTVGETVSFGDLAWLRGPRGFRPGDEDRVVGRRLVRDIAEGEFLRPEDVT
jgi:N,N'-diacetyllegionaminate synthase